MNSKFEIATSIWIVTTSIVTTSKYLYRARIILLGLFWSVTFAALFSFLASCDWINTYLVWKPYFHFHQMSIIVESIAVAMVISTGVVLQGQNVCTFCGPDEGSDDASNPPLIDNEASVDRQEVQEKITEGKRVPQSALKGSSDKPSSHSISSTTRIESTRTASTRTASTRTASTRTGLEISTFNLKTNQGTGTLLNRHTATNQKAKNRAIRFTNQTKSISESLLLRLTSQKAEVEKRIAILRRENEKREMQRLKDLSPCKISLKQATKIYYRGTVTSRSRERSQ